MSGFVTAAYISVKSLDYRTKVLVNTAHVDKCKLHSLAMFHSSLVFHGEIIKHECNSYIKYLKIMMNPSALGNEKFMYIYIKKKKYSG